MNGIILAEVEDIELGGVDHRDYPDYCDTYIESATFKGRDLTEEELDWLTEEMADQLGEMAYQSAL